MNIDQLQDATILVWRSNSLTMHHDWRGYLWLDFDLSGLPCGKQAEESQKGYFSGKRTSLDVSWPGSVPFDTAKRFGLTCSRAANIRCIASGRLCSQPKML